MYKKEYFVCSCQSNEHMLVCSYDTYEQIDQDDWFYIMPHLDPQPFWKRVAYAVRYILGHRSKYGAFTEICLDTKSASALADTINDYLKENKIDPRS